MKSSDAYPHTGQARNASAAQAGPHCRQASQESAAQTSGNDAIEAKILAVAATSRCTFATRVTSRKSKIPAEAGGTQPGNQEPGPKLDPVAQLPSEVT